jgi:hypothetical protein
VGGAPLLQKSFAGLRVDRTTAEIMSCGEPSACSDGVSRHEIPFTHFVGHKAHTTSHGVKVRIDANTSLLVPCTEVVRRYFGDSGLLVSKMFSGAMAAQTLFDSEASGINRLTRVANLRLGKDLTYHAASAVARIAFDPVAGQAFQGLVNSGVACAANRTPWYVKAKFPFEGVTDLNVRGLWLERGPDRTFLALQILSCSHPFPFDKLFFELYSGGSAGSSAGGPERRVATSEQAAGSSAGNGARGLDVGYANQDLSPLILDDESEPSDPFPDLASKKIFQIRKEAGASRGASPSQSGDQPLASADSPHSKDAPRGTEIVAQRRLYLGGQPEPRSLLWLREEVAYSLPEVQAKSPFEARPASRHVIRYGPPLGRKASAIWATVFRYEALKGVGRSFLCTVVETPATPASIELLMFDLPRPQALDAEMFNRLALLSFVPADNLIREARGTELRIGWSADKLAERDGSALAVEMVEMMLEAFDQPSARRRE